MSAVLNSGLPMERPAVQSTPHSGVVAGADHAPKKQTAVERIEASRALLRDAMTTSAKPSTSTGEGRSSTVKAVSDALRHVPGLSLIADAAIQWWAKHPLHDASVIAREASSAILRPIARENPMKLVFGGLVFGALLVILKPWRFILRSAIFAGLVPQLAAMALRRLPLLTWINMFARRPKAAGSSRKLGVK